MDGFMSAMKLSADSNSFLNAINVERYGLIAEDVKKGSLAQMRAE